MKAPLLERGFSVFFSISNVGFSSPNGTLLRNGSNTRSDHSVLPYAAVYAMLPPQVAAMIHGVEQGQDATIAELYRGKLTFGEYNVEMNRMRQQLVQALSGVPVSPQPTSAATESSVRPDKAAKPQTSPSRPLLEGTVTAPVDSSSETRLALVIGNSNYVNLPKLTNPTNDAREIAEILQKIGYKTQLVLDASEQTIRREVRKFAGESDGANVALVYYAGHGAQVNGNNYLLPVDMDIPRTEVDIEFTGLKVDDLVNSVRSNTKIIFLDACRDNPVLSKNLVKVSRNRRWLCGSRTGSAAMRLKKTRALARKLLVALWKYVTAGVVIEGAIVKSA